jgi:hypothetical protein
MSPPWPSALPRARFGDIKPDRAHASIPRLWPTRCSIWRSPSAREVMRSTTAVRLNTRLRESPQDLANVLVRRAVRTQNERRTRRLRCRPAIYPSRLNPGTEIAFPLVRGRTVGLGGLEPPTSSLSAITRSPPCNPAFSQVARDRKGRSNALSESVREERLGPARKSGRRARARFHRHTALALKMPSDLHRTTSSST